MSTQWWQHALRKPEKTRVDRAAGHIASCVKTLCSTCFAADRVIDKEKLRQRDVDIQMRRA